MKRSLIRFVAASKGATIVEFAIAAPVLLGLLIGMTQLGVLFFANAGLRTAVEEGARFATVWPRPSATQIEAFMVDKRFGLQANKIVGPTITPQVAVRPYYYDITMGYNIDVNYVVGRKTVTISHTRRAYTP